MTDNLELGQDRGQETEERTEGTRRYEKSRERGERLQVSEYSEYFL
jgi:hypothetical protein